MACAVEPSTAIESSTMQDAQTCIDSHAHLTPHDTPVATDVIDGDEATTAQRRSSTATTTTTTTTATTPPTARFVASNCMANDMMVWVKFGRMKEEISCAGIRNVAAFRRSVKSVFEIQRAAPFVVLLHPLGRQLDPDTLMSHELFDGVSAVAPIRVEVMGYGEDDDVCTCKCSCCVKKGCGVVMGSRSFAKKASSSVSPSSASTTTLAASRESTPVAARKATAAPGSGAVAGFKHVSATMPDAGDSKNRRSMRSVSVDTTLPCDNTAQKHTTKSLITNNTDEATTHTERLNKKRAKRERIVQEILSSEQKYVASLDVIVTTFLEALERSRAESGLQHDDIKAIFGNIRVILACNRQLLADLEQSRRNASCAADTIIGNVFRQVVEYLRLYIHYVKNYAASSSVLRRLYRDNAAFAREMAQLESGTSLSLKDHLIMPVQRIPRYILLLHDLHRNTWPGHNDYETLGVAVDKMRQLAEQVEYAQNKESNIIRITEIQAQLRSAPTIQLLQPGRVFIKEDAVMFRVDGDSGFKARQAFLFSDLLLLAKASVRKQTDRPYRAKTVLSLGTISSLREVKISHQTAAAAHVSTSKAVGVTVGGGARNFMMAAATEQATSDWLSDLLKCVVALDKGEANQVSLSRVASVPAFVNKRLKKQNQSTTSINNNTNTTTTTTSNNNSNSASPTPVRAARPVSTTSTASSEPTTTTWPNSPSPASPALAPSLAATHDGGCKPRSCNSSLTDSNARIASNNMSVEHAAIIPVDQRQALPTLSPPVDKLPAATSALNRVAFGVPARSSPFLRAMPSGNARSKSFIIMSSNPPIPRHEADDKLTDDQQQDEHVYGDINQQAQQPTQVLDDDTAVELDADANDAIDTVTKVVDFDEAPDTQSALAASSQTLDAASVSSIVISRSSANYKAKRLSMRRESSWIAVSSPGPRQRNLTSQRSGIGGTPQPSSGRPSTFLSPLSISHTSTSTTPCSSSSDPPSSPSTSSAPTSTSTPAASSDSLTNSISSSAAKAPMLSVDASDGDETSEQGALTATRAIRRGTLLIYDVHSQPDLEDESVYEIVMSDSDEDSDTDCDYLSFVTPHYERSESELDEGVREYFF
jgi:hypothetical protein